MAQQAGTAGGPRRRTVWIAALGIAVAVAVVAVVAGMLATPTGNRYDLVLYIQPPNSHVYVSPTASRGGLAREPAWFASCTAPTLETGSVVSRGVVSVPPLQAPTWQQIVCPVSTLPTAVGAPVGQIPGTITIISAVQGVVNGHVTFTSGCVSEEVVADGASRELRPCLGAGSGS
jgi:hypothetical protein